MMHWHSNALEGFFLVPNAVDQIRRAGLGTTGNRDGVAGEGWALEKSLCGKNQGSCNQNLKCLQSCVRRAKERGCRGICESQPASAQERGCCSESASAELSLPSTLYSSLTSYRGNWETEFLQHVKTFLPERYLEHDEGQGERRKQKEQKSMEEETQAVGTDVCCQTSALVPTELNGEISNLSHRPQRGC